MLARMDMKGRVAVVTGAGGGLGGTTALRLAELGADLALVDVSEAALAETAAKAREKGANVLEITRNLADPDECTATIEDAVKEFGRLDSLCNVAGVLRCGRSEDFPAEDWRLVMAVNLDAPFFLSRAAVPHMIEKGGYVVNVCSTASFNSQGFFSAYCASKAGLLHLTKTMAVEYIKTPIHFNAVAPGGMETELAAAAGPAATLDPDIFNRLGNPRGFCVIDDVAEMVVYLATPAARSIQGSCFTVDTGEVVF